MSNFFDKENAENIRKINAGFGTKHRSTPYDLNNADDLSEALTLTIAAYMDYTYYWCSLGQIEESFDESLEHFDTASWINMTYRPEKADELALGAAASLRETEDLFRELAQRAEKNCAAMLKAALSAPSETQKRVLGQVHNIDPSGLDALLEALFEGAAELDYKYSIPDNRDAFLEHLNLFLSE